MIDMMYPRGGLSAITLKRTDTTLDLSQNGKGSLGEKGRIGENEGLYR